MATWCITKEYQTSRIFVTANLKSHGRGKKVREIIRNIFISINLFFFFSFSSPHNSNCVQLPVWLLVQCHWWRLFVCSENLHYSPNLGSTGQLFYRLNCIPDKCSHFHPHCLTTHRFWCRAKCVYIESGTDHAPHKNDIMQLLRSCICLTVSLLHTHTYRRSDFVYTQLLWVWKKKNRPATTLKCEKLAIKCGKCNEKKNSIVICDFKTDFN